MKRYLRIWLSFMQMSWMADLEYRLNITVRVFGEFSWYIAQLSIFEVLYLHTSTISGWDVNGMRVFMGTLFLVDCFYMIFFMENLDYVGSLVRKGDLDLYLVKPIASQFMVSCRKIATAYVLNFVLILSYLIWAILRLPNALSWYQMLCYLILLGFGSVTLYSLRFMFSTLSVVLQDAGNVQFIWYQLWKLGTRPDPIYPFYLRVFVMTALPVAFFASVPARVLVEGVSWSFMLAAPAMAIFLLWLSSRLWNAALRKYSSASS